MRFYDFKDIEEHGSCIRFVRECLGQKVENDRCVATWRGGKNMNVALTDRGWKDHKTKEHGGIIKLCAMTKFGGNTQQAQEYLGDWLGLTPKNTTVRLAYDYRKSTYYKELIQKGYHEVCKYVYRNADGAEAHYVVRLEHPTEKKEFIQCTPWSGSLKNVETFLYNLPAIKDSDRVVVVEGEKDADTLIALGVTATTCNNGAKNWKEAYTETLRGKHVTICRDNDDDGEAHASIVLRALAGAAASLRVINPSKRPKGDVTDWFEKEGGSLKELCALVQNAPIISPDEAMLSDEKLAVYHAKKANETPFANYETVEVTRGGKTRTVETPRTVSAMLADMRVRFLGFPRRIGETELFDHDRDSGDIHYIRTNAGLFSWMGEKSDRPVNWKNGIGYLTKEEFLQAVVKNAARYERIVTTPIWPSRSDVYFTFRGKVEPTPGHRAFNEFMSFFNPGDECSAALMRAFAASMMFFQYGVQRPCWIIDSRDGQGVGKSTFAEMVAKLYGQDMMTIPRSMLERDCDEVIKRIVSTDGRKKQMVVFDNVTGVFRSEFFASLVTLSSISGRSPYAAGEETRPNDITFVITYNSASADSDIASRAFLFYISRPKSGDSQWKKRVLDWIERNRMAALFDIFDILQNTPVPDDIAPVTRFPEFELQVLYKMIGDPALFRRVTDHILTVRNSINVDEDNATQTVEIVREKLSEVMGYATDDSRLDEWVFFIRTNAIKEWLKSLKLDVQDVRNFINTRRITCLRAEPYRFPRSSASRMRASGLMFVGSRAAVYGQHTVEPHVNVQIIALDSKGNAHKLGDPVPDTQLAVQILNERNPPIEVASSLRPSSSSDALPVAAQSPALEDNPFIEF